MSPFNYVGTPNSNLICCICRAPFNDPITTLTCQHTFCRECIMRALSHAPQCPVDRSPLSETEFVPTSSIVRSMVDELIVECVYKQDGCSYQGERQQLASHLQEKCLFSEDGKYRREVEGRQPEPLMALAEEGEIPSSTNRESSRQAAQSMPVESKSPSNAHDPRVSRLTEQNILLRHRVESLETMVQVFKKEMNAVKTILGPWMRNAVTTPAPTLRNHAESVSELLPSTFVDPVPLSAIPGSSSFASSQSSSTPSIGPPSPPESTVGDDSSSSYTSPPPSGSSAINTEDLASYFPAEDEVRVQRQSHPQNQPHQSPSYTHRPRPGHSHHHSVPTILSGDPYSNYASNFSYSMGHGGYNTMSPSFTAYAAGPSSLATSIAELDTSSPSLLQTLQGLHSNVASLSSNIDELNRKADLALSLIGGGGVTLLNGGVVGEVLRLGEEVMGVRANVQGLRMQVHGMLMGAVGVGASSSTVNPGLPRPPNRQSSPNPDDDVIPVGRGQVPFVTSLGSPSMGLHPMQRFGPFPGALGITKL